MAHRNVHYDAAFENYLRAKGWPYVAVDEAKKAIFAGAAVKSFDFLVYSGSGPNLLVDVKGRKFPDGVRGRQRGADKAYENWITRDDADGLREWEKVFGRDFAAVLVFAYWLQGPPERSPFGDVHFFKDKCMVRPLLVGDRDDAIYYIVVGGIFRRLPATDPASQQDNRTDGDRSPSTE